MKKVIQAMAVMLFAALLFPNTASSQTLINGLYYTLNSTTGEATVAMSGSGNSDYEGDIVIPETVESNGKQYTVTAIGPNAFKGSNITSIIIPGTVTSLDDSALKNCTQLTSITCYAIIPPKCVAKTFQNITNNPMQVYIPAESFNDYKTATGWEDIVKDANLDNIVFSTFYILHDSQESYNDNSDNSYNLVQYIRNFKNTNWQALYLPFAMNYADWADNYEIAAITDILESKNANNEVYDFYVEGTLIEEGGRTNANELYLIRAKTTSNDTITTSVQNGIDSNKNPLYTTYAAPASNVTKVFDKGNNSYTFTGRYQKGAIGDLEAYALTGGALKRATSIDVPLGSFRWLLTISGPTQLFSNNSHSIMYGEKNATAIEEIKREESGVKIYFDLNGRQVKNPEQGKMYIYNNKIICL